MNKTHTLHVGLNAHLLSLDRNYRGAGSNWYIYHMLCHLPVAAPDLRYTAYTHESRFSPPNGMRVRRSRWPTVGPMRRIAWEQLAAPVVLRRERVDLMHAMAFVAPVIRSCPTVVTVLDLSFLLYPAAFKGINRAYLRLMTGISARSAGRVIAISESTRRDVIQWLKVPAERVQTITCGVDPTFRPLPRAEVEAFRQRKGLPERYILFLGTIQPRKNVLRLVDAFAALLSSLPTELADVHLIVAGGKGWLYEPVFARVEEMGLQDRVHFAGYVPEGEKRWWYNAATCFCFPSLYEGFGLPPLEAMACGTPVITSDVSSLPEVVGEAGLTVPPTDVRALSDALRRVLVDPALRAHMAEKGLARSRRFSWAKAARETAAAYRLVGGV